MCWCGCQAWRRGCCQGQGASAGWWLAALATGGSCASAPATCWSGAGSSGTWPPCPRATAPCRLTVQCGRRAGRDGWWPWWVGSRRGMSGLSYPCSCNPTPKGTEVLRAFPWRRGRLHGPGQCRGPGAREHLAAALQHLALGRRSRAGAKLVSAAFPWRRGRPAGCAPCLAAARSSSWPPHAGCCCSPQRHASSWPPAPPPARWFPTTGSLTPSSF